VDDGAADVERHAADDRGIAARQIHIPELARR
jgi:hypothetical protein